MISSSLYNPPLNPVSQYARTSGADMDAATALAVPHENHAILRFANLRSIDPGPF